ALHQFVRHQDVDHATAIAVRTHKVLQIQCRLAEKLVATLVFQHQELPLDRSNRLFGDVSILGGQVCGVLGDVRQNGPQVLHVEQQQALFVRDLECDI